jgi:hypothetical protein
MKLNKDHIKRVEINIRPLFHQAITLPVELDKVKDSLVAIYISTFMYGPRVPDDVLIEIANKLELREEK